MRAMRDTRWRVCGLPGTLGALIGTLAACSSSEGVAGNAAGEGDPASGGASVGTGSGGVPGAGGAMPVPSTCGNGGIEAPEECDGANLAGQTCASATMNAQPNGTLGCSAACLFVTTGCSGSGADSGAGGGSGTGGGSGSGGGTGLGGTSNVGGPPSGGTSPSPTSCTGFAPTPTTDYGASGPFATTTVTGTGPGGQYTMFRPTTLGENGFRHPPTTWGNGITTMPEHYPGLLGTIASHGFVVIASNSTNVTAQLMTAGLDWLIQQNDVPGEFQGKLATSCAVSIGYSLGGGAAVTTGAHPNVVTTVSFHGLTGPAEALHGPLLLFSSTGDTFVSAAQFVTPTFNRSTVQTFYATLTGGSHVTPIGTAGDERAPAVAWLRLWVYDDPGARPFFHGDGCTLCSAPWTNPQRKNWPP